jgi:hypothetical protein
VQAKYAHLSELARIARDPSSRWCPTAGCSSVLRGGSAEHPRMRCAACDTDACFMCGGVWHEAITCAEASSVQLMAFLEESGAELDIKSCPSCLEGIQRTDGCNFIRCPRCQHEFCWICMQPYTETHYAWWNLRGCPLLHLQSCAWAGDASCCCCMCGPWMGRLKRGVLRSFLFFIYAILFIVALPFIIIAAPYLLYRYHRDRPARERRRQLKERNEQMAKAQLARARGPKPTAAEEAPLPTTSTELEMNPSSHPAHASPNAGPI